MVKLRKYLKVAVLCLTGFLSLNCLLVLMISDNFENDFNTALLPLMTPSTLAKLTKSVVKEREKINPSDIKRTARTTRAINTTTLSHLKIKNAARIVHSDGFNLSERVFKKCRGPKRLPGYINNWRQLRLHAIFETKDKHVQLCPVWKAGTTFLRRLFLIKNKEEYSSYKNPYDISFFENYSMPSKLISSSEKSQRFMFVRNPYKRVFSSFVDKLVAPNPYYWNAIGTRAIYLFRSDLYQHSRRCGHDVSFPEYVKYVVAALGYKTPGAQTDPHFLPVYQLCQPCTVNYKFIGKVETFKADFPVLLKALNLSQEDDILNVLERDGDELAALDAIQDTVESGLNPEFRDHLNSCIPFKEVLERIWKKLKLRGLISPSPPPVSFANATNMTVLELVELAKDSRRRSTQEERTAYQQQQFAEFYKQVPAYDLERLRLAYLYDFRVLEYDEKPPEIFGNE